MALPPRINFRDMTVEDVIESLKNNGYFTSRRDEHFFKYALQGYFKYNGYTDDEVYNRFIFVAEDDYRVDERRFIIIRVHVWVNRHGDCVAAYSGIPLVNDLTEQEAYDRLDAICN